MPVRQLLIRNYKVGPGAGGNPPPPPPTTLDSVSASEFQAATCALGLSEEVSCMYNTSNADDTRYQINILRSSDGGSFTSWLTGLTTSSSAVIDDSGIVQEAGGTFGSPASMTRQYRVSLIRKSDSATITTLDTGTVSQTFGPCI